MTSNSRARRLLPVLLPIWLAPGASASAEPPLPALHGAPPVVAAVDTPVAAPPRVRLVSARIVGVAGDDRRLRLLDGAGRDFRAREGIMLEARVAVPFGNLERTSSPVIVIDGRPVDSAVDEESRSVVYALLPPWASAQAATMQVGWLGDFERTLSNPVRISLAAPPRRRR